MTHVPADKLDRMAEGGEHGQQGPTVSRPTYRLIQILRAVAALMVVVHHATLLLWSRDRLPVGNWLSGAAGVDLFFVISGFVMTISSEPLRKVPRPARTFLARRLERIVPLYWLITTIKVAVLLIVPALGQNALGSFAHIAKSYLFFPSRNALGNLQPVVIVGWTLNYEMWFYVLFAVALALRRRPIWLVGPVLIGFTAWAASGHLRLPYWLLFYENTLQIEFLFGMLLGLGAPYLRQAPWQLGLLVAGLGFIPLLGWGTTIVSLQRGFQWGLPAMGVIAGAVMLEGRWGARSPRWMLELGDASYSIYLVHTFALPAIGLLLLRGPHGWPGEIPVSLTAAVILSALSGELTYRFVEWPITRWFKGRRRTAIPAVPV